MFLRLFSLFSGIGAFEKALTRLNIPFEIIGFSEIDKYAVKAYCAIHDISSSKNFGDITLIDEKSLPDFDLLTYGFPCQDLSLSGKRQGLIDENGNKTKSGLIFDALRIIQYKKPKYAIAENVKGLVTRKFKKDFEWLLQELESYGYNNYWKVLNAKDYGIPQNRERVFIVSIRKDIDDGTFDFPKPIGCKLKLKDLLEDKVDEKYYISNEKVQEFFKKLQTSYQDIKTLNENNRLVFLGNIGNSNSQGQRVYSVEGISTTMSAHSGGLGAKTGLYMVYDSYRKSYRIRRLTPLECWRLMGFDDEDFWKARNTRLSNTQLYKLAGNSIVVNVLEAIFKELFCMISKYYSIAGLP